MRRNPGDLATLFAFLLCASTAFADSPPPPMTSSVYEFPGAVPSPGSAASAGVGLSDRWLGDEPFENPAIGAANRISISPLLYHVSRQDLRGLNRSYSETSAFFDASGAWAAWHTGSLALFAYGHQPVLRLEQNAYLTGPLSGSPAPVENSSHAREARAGGGFSTSVLGWRFGVAGEWTHRDDSYATVDKSGSPLSGSSEASFSGSAVGGQAGLRGEFGPPDANHVSVGLGLRYVPELEVEGERVANLVTGNSSGSFTATRESGLEGGLSVRWSATPQVRVLAGMGGRTEQEWKGFGLTRGAGASWGLGVDFHDARDPWTLRFGLGQDNESGVPEPHNGVVGLGFGWNMEGTTIDLAVLRHSFSHLDAATSYDDRVVLSAVVGW